MYIKEEITMKKYNLSLAIRNLLTSRCRTYYASVYIAGRKLVIPIEAPNYHYARMEAEAILDDCGVLFDIIEA